MEPRVQGRIERTQLPYDVITQHLDWGDHTRVVDPVRRGAWINHGDDDTHLETTNRGRGFDTREKNKVLSLLQGAPTSRGANFMPTTADIKPRFESRALASQPDAVGDVPGGSGMERWNSRNASLHEWRGVKADPSNYGRMPSIHNLLRENRLPNKAPDVIHREMLADQQRRHERMFDRGGTPDYGKPSPSVYSVPKI